MFRVNCAIDVISGCGARGARGSASTRAGDVGGACIGAGDWSVLHRHEHHPWYRKEAASRLSADPTASQAR